MGLERLSVATADGAELAVVVEGDGPPLMLVTGLGGNGRFWAPAAAKLAQRHRVVTFDHRGIGASTRGAAPLDMPLLARDCATILDALGIDHTVLLGHSMGGAIGQVFARDHGPRLSGLVLSATWGAPNRFMTELFTARRALLAADGAAYATMATLLGYPPDWLDANWAMLDAARLFAPSTEAQRLIVGERIDALLAFDGSGCLDAWRGPLLVQGARDDMIVPAYLQEALAATLPGAGLHFFSDGGHLFPVSRTDAFVETLLAWTSRP